MDAEITFDQAIISAKTQDSTAISWLWKRHQPALKGWLCSFDGQIADDVSSEAWIEAIRSLDRFEGDESNFRSWLFTIARRRLIDRQRRENRRNDIMAGQFSDTPRPTAPGLESFDDLETREAITEILQHLPPEQAEIVLLRVVAGLDAGEVAQITGRSTSSVRVLQHRALRKLARSLKSQVSEAEV